MVRVSVFYDEEVKGQVFKVRGDERYARTTKTTIELGSVTMNEATFDLDINVNVYRDVGSSNIVIYDNDVIIYNEIWTSTDTARTITLEDMAFEIEHNIVAKYMGNDRCSPSSSKIVEKQEVDPRRTEALITINNDDVQLVPHDNFTATVTLDNGIDPDWNDDQLIDIIYDGTLVTTVNTSESTTFTISDVGDNGLHSLEIAYGGSTHLIAKTVDIDFSVGYNGIVGTVPEVVIEGDTLNVPLRLLDYFGEPVPDVEIELCGLYGTEWTDLDVETTNNDGIATFSWVVSEDSDMQLMLLEGYSFTYAWTQKIVSFNSMTITATPPRLIKGSNSSSVLTVDTGVPMKDIPIELSGYVSDTLYTNNNGVATKNVWGEGYGSKTINATAGGVTVPITLEDYIQYWNGMENDGELYYNEGNGMNVVQYANALVTLTPTNENYLGRVHFSNVIYTNWVLELESVDTSSSSNYYIGARYVNSNGQSVDWSNLIPVTLVNANITVRRSGGNLTISIWKDNTSYAIFSVNNVSTTPKTGLAPHIGLKYTGTQKQLKFRKLTLRAWD